MSKHPLYTDFSSHGARPEEDVVCPVVDPGPDLVMPQADEPDAEQVNREQNGASGRCPQCEEADGARLRALADLDNARKRLAREKEEFIRYAAENVLSDILPALDNLDLALAYAPQDPASKNFVVGVDMTRKLLLEALARHGLEQVGALGETFDPAVHEAVGTEDSPEYASGLVCGLMNKGYRLKDRLLRPARVTVCKK